MKIIGRILIILVAAFVVIGAAVAFTRTDFAAQLLPGGRGGVFADGREGFNSSDSRHNDMDSGSLVGFDAGEFRHGGERHGERLGGAFGNFSLMGLGRNLLTIAVIVLLVVVVSRLFSRRKSKVAVTE